MLCEPISMWGIHVSEHRRGHRAHGFLLLVLLALSAPMGAQTTRRTSAPRPSTAECLACHDDPNLKKTVDGQTVSVHVSERAFRASVHGAFECAECHADVRGYPHEPPPQKVSCATCHPDVEAAYAESLHAKAAREGRARGASCADCHGDVHALAPSSDPRSKTHRARIPQTCGACHGVQFVVEPAGISAQPFFSYQQSVHGRAVAAGSTRAAVCTDCHHSHDVRSAANPRSPIFKFNVPETCGHCHTAIRDEFLESIHGQAIRRGNWQAPVCTDCHGIHLIKPHIDPTSPVAQQALARTTCGRCHEGVRLTEEFGVPGGRVSTYLDSYHGRASQLGSTIVANCASCHGVHNILPSSDPRSMVHKANLARTCGQCHPGASENFARVKVHAEVPVSEDIGSLLKHWVRRIYLWLIALTIGLMALHNGAIWRKKALARRALDDRSILRLTPRQRWQHMLLLVSFFTLVLTGFALKYPDSWLAWVLGSSETFRRIVHRVAGVVLLGIGAFHLVYILATAEGRHVWRDMRPRRKDLADLIQNMRYFFGRSAHRPLFDRCSYIEKVEYWALVWGTIVMGTTGLMVWFKAQTTRWLPGWAVDVALAIHFYEAVLATLAIVVWHFYHVIFDPDVYPMNWAWLDGRVSARWYQHEHPLDYARLAAQSESAGVASRDAADGVVTADPAPSEDSVQASEDPPSDADLSEGDARCSNG
jgi:cytochrome b subunit of formate dehydrogenase